MNRGSCTNPRENFRLRQEELKKRKWVKAHCYSCDWDGYTDNLEDACYGCGEYESLKEVPPDENADVNHADFC